VFRLSIKIIFIAKSDWDKAIDEQHDKIDGYINTIGKYTYVPTQPLHIANKLTTMQAKAFTAEVNNFEKTTGISAQKQIEQGIGPAARMFDFDPVLP
jgi:hypothetical protein